MFHQEGGETLFHSRRCEMKILYLYIYIIFILFSCCLFVTIFLLFSIMHMQHMSSSISSQLKQWACTHMNQTGETCLFPKIKMPKSWIEFAAARPWELHVALKQSLVRRRVIKACSEFRDFLTKHWTCFLGCCVTVPLSFL